MIRIPDLIDRKRRGDALSREELETLVLGYTRGVVPDYQVAAWLMAVVWRGMGDRELADLTAIMVDSGRRLDLTGLGRTVADKHSTGGVGDKTTLVVVPLAAACGLAVAKLSGRGLGFTGGTLDKLEAIPGLRVDLEPDRFVEQVGRIGLAIAGQSADLAPADGKLYALRDVTATVESIPLVASSVMSKKLAAGAEIIVLDVKVGSGAFVPTLDQARELAERMVAIGRAAGRRTAAYVTDMSQPIGRAVGNALEVVEAIETLRGQGPSDVTELATALTGEMLAQADLAANRRAGQDLAEAALRDGRGLAKLRELVVAQGGDPGAIDVPERLPRAPLRRLVTAPRAGLVTRLDARQVAHVALALGAGRTRKGDAIDPGVGLVLAAKVGERVERGQALATLYAADEPSCERAERLFTAAVAVAAEPAPIAPLIHWRSGSP